MRDSGEHGGIVFVVSVNYENNLHYTFRIARDNAFCLWRQCRK